MSRKEKISEERKKLIQEFIKNNDLKTAGDIQEAIKDLFKRYNSVDAECRINRAFRVWKNEYTNENDNYRNGYSQKQYIHLNEI